MFELSELSKALLGRYMKKALWDNKKHRSEGMEAAAKKLRKEDIEINELSTKTLMSYVSKRPSSKNNVKSMKSAVARLGVDHHIGEIINKIKMKRKTNEELNELDKETLEKFITKSLEKRVGMYIDGKVAGHLMSKHMQSMNLAQDKIDKQNKKELGKIFDKKKLHKESIVDRLHRQIQEEMPTNVMGNSSSTSGTGPIDTFDPLLMKKIKKRKIKVKE